MSFHRTLSRWIAEGTHLVPEDAAKSLLSGYGLSAPAGSRVHTPAEARRAAELLGYPLAAKAIAPDLIHKSDRGAVKLGIASPEALDTAVAELAAAFPGAPLLIEGMAPSGVELILGLQHDPQFGPCLMLGTGGVLTDLFRDVRFLMLPASLREIEAALRSLRGFPLLAGYRGKLPCDVEAVLEAALGLARFGEDHAGLWESVDVNPLSAYPEGCLALDAKILLSGHPQKTSLEPAAPRSENLECFFSPRSVAVVGASPTPEKIGHVIMENLVLHDYRGRVYPVTPAHPEVLGIPTVPSISDLPEPVDLLIIATDLTLVPGMLEECARVGIRAVHLPAGGGRELGGERAGIEGEIREKARAHGIRVLGPNCIGSFSGVSGLDAFFLPHERLRRPPAGPLAMTSQSGTFGIRYMHMAANVGAHAIVSYGNRADVDEADLLDHMAKDPRVRVLSCYIEGLEDGRKFAATARRAIAEHGTPVVVYKTGRTPLAARAAVGHTGAYGGSYEVYRDVLRQHGVVDTDSFEQFAAASRAIALQPLPAGNRVAVLSNGAGIMIAAMDHFAARGLQMARFSPESVARMREAFKFFYAVENPVDLTGSASTDDFLFAVRQLLEDDAVDLILAWFVFEDPTIDDTLPKRLGALLKGATKPLVGGAAGGPYPRRMIRRMERHGIPMCASADTWTAAARALVRAAEARREAERV